MLDYSDLTIVKNADGIPTALGYAINSLLLRSNKPLFVGGKKKKGEGKKKEEESSDPDFDQLVVPAGLVCMTETICTRPAHSGIAKLNDETEQQFETIPEGLYEKLLALAETKQGKKLSRTKNSRKQKPKNKTHKRKQ
jgi:hypothetical protein